MAERLVIGMSGASGAPLTVELLRQLRETHSEVETHLVVTRGGELTLAQETEITLDELKGLASVCHENGNIGAAIASGSFKTMGMIVAPCSMKTVAGIVSGYSDNLLLRAADVCLPIVRETGGLKDTVEPYNLFSGAGNGFTFDRYDAGLLLDAINRAKALYFEHRDGWDEMVQRDMEKDLS